MLITRRTLGALAAAGAGTALLGRAVRAARADDDAPLPPITFDFKDRGTINLDVASIAVEDAYVPPMRDPYVEHRLTMSPSAGVRLWATERLKAVGTTGRARLIVKEGSIRETHLKVHTGVSGWFHKDQSEQYDGKIVVELVIEGSGRGFSGGAGATVTASTTVAENVTLAQRERAMQRLVREMLDDMDKQLAATIKDTLFPVLVL
jgi:hypothetical protein